MKDIIEEIRELQQQRDAVIMAHYYVEKEVQEIATYVGDSYFLSKKATEIEANTIVVCGVSFMGESAKLLNPNKLVLLPDMSADCPMAHMVEVEEVERMRGLYADLAVVCYVNSSAVLKAASDVCVTSANALEVVRELPNQHIYFIPDEHLGRFIAKMLPDKHFIYNNGYCPVHRMITTDRLHKMKSNHPNAKILVHPECTEDVCNMADYAGSTAGIIEYATNSLDKEFIIGTEEGVAYELRKRNPDKIFYLLEKVICADMKKITLEKVRDCLRNISGEVVLDSVIATSSVKSLNKMLELAALGKERM